MDRIEITKEQHIINREKFMTKDEMVEIDGYLSDLLVNKGDMTALYNEWADIEKYYENEQDEIQDMPNTKINIMNSNIEGQVAMIVDQDMAIMTKGESAGDDDFADDARVGLEWTFRKNFIKKVMKSFIRKYSKFGAGCFMVHFDNKALDKFGLTKVYSKSLTNVFVDGKVKDPLRYQEADWIADASFVSKKQLIKWYGEEKADMVVYGNNTIVGESTFDVDDSSEDTNGTTLVKWWSRCEDKLRLQEFTGDGSLMYDSHKGGTRKSNQKNSEYNHKSYYKYVADRYPYFFSFLYEREGNLWAFGDGKLLLPLQKLINKLYDNILVCSKPDLPLVDTRSNIDTGKIDDNSNAPIPFDGEELNGAPPIYSIRWGTTNDNWWNLINAMHNEVQRITRFSDIMTGQASKGTDTATEAAIQQQQGSRSTDDKKGDIQTTLEEMCGYILGIMMEKYKRAKSFKVSDEKSEYKWIDFREMSRVPVKIPATKKFRDEFMKNNNNQIPQWELLTEGDGSPVTKNLELDIEINIGAGLPKNKAFITKLMQELAQVQLVTKDGQMKPALYFDEFRDFMQKFIGMPIDNEDTASFASIPETQLNPTTKPTVNADMPLGQNEGVKTGPTQEARLA